jgi:hypothetical protein
MYLLEFKLMGAEVLILLSVVSDKSLLISNTPISSTINLVPSMYIFFPYPFPHFQIFLFRLKNKAVFSTN